MIYLATRTDMPPSYPPLTATEAATFGQHWDRSIHAEILMLDPATNAQTLIYQADNVWAITRLTTLDGDLYWAQVPDGTSVIDALRNGSLNADYTFDDLFTTYLLPDIYRMPLSDGEAELVAENIQRFIPIRTPTTN
jgi:hypothetical protein